MARSNTRIQKLTRVSTLADGDTIPTGPASGDVAKGMTFLNLKTLLNAAGTESTVEVTGTYQQLISDNNIVFTGPGTLILIKASTALHGVSVKSKLGGGDVTVSPFTGDSVDAASTLVIEPGTGQNLAPITLDWEVMA